MEWNIAQDVDECLFNSVSKHTRLTPTVARSMGFQKLADMILPYGEVIRRGGSTGAFGQFEGYSEVNEFLRNDPDFNRGIEVIPGAIEAIVLLQSYLAVYLTTRPKHLARLTLEELVAAGFPERLVITRPNDVPIEKTTEWKMWMLAELARADGRAKLMIDDSLKMRKAIKAKRSKRIDSILFKGPITQEGNGEMTWEEISAVILMSGDWKTLQHHLALRNRRIE